jgi:hypothetical protein
LLTEKLETLSESELRRRQQSAEVALMNMGITFNVYGNEDGAEKIIPFDIIPRIIEATYSRAQPLSKRHLSRPENFIRWHHSIACDRIIKRLSQALHWADTAQRYLVPYFRH